MGQFPVPSSPVPCPKLPVPSFLSPVPCPKFPLPSSLSQVPCPQLGCPQFPFPQLPPSSSLPTVCCPQFLSPAPWLPVPSPQVPVPKPHLFSSFQPIPAEGPHPERGRFFLRSRTEIPHVGTCAAQVVAYHCLSVLCGRAQGAPQEGAQRYQAQTANATYHKS